MSDGETADEAAIRDSPGRPVCGHARGSAVVRRGLRHPHRQWPHRRRHRVAVVRGRRRHPGRPDRGDRRLAGAAAQRRRIDAAGQVVAPGFIDMLGQSEMTILVEPHLPSKIFQGITTEITGEGGSAAPLNDAIVKADRFGYEHSTSRPTGARSAQYFARRREAGHRHQPRAPTSARRRCGAWFSATPTSSPRRRSSIG